MQQPADGPSLHPHQQAVLADLVAAYEQDHSEFRVYNGKRIRHKALDESIKVNEGDIVALQRAGVIDVVAASDRGRISKFAITALATASVRPAD